MVGVQKETLFGQEEKDAGTKMAGGIQILGHFCWNRELKGAIESTRGKRSVS